MSKLHKRSAALLAIPFLDFATDWMMSGDQVEQADENGKLYTVPDRVRLKTGKAVLHAFNALAGKELDHSGDAMKQFTHFSGLAIADRRLFATTYDGMIYASGLQCL